MFRSVFSLKSRSVSLVLRNSPVVQLSGRLGQVRGYASGAGHGEEESFEAYNQRYAAFFDTCDDLFELQRGLNNCFSYDMVPDVKVLESALRASRRVNDFATAVRVFEGIKGKLQNTQQYEEYVNALKSVKEELGIPTKEELGF